MSRSKTRTLAEVETTETPEEVETVEREERRTSVKHKERSGRNSSFWNWGKVEDGKPRGWGYASMYLWFIVAPIVIWIILFTVKPCFVTDSINGVVTINCQKHLLWTLIFSIIAWILIYAIYYCKY